ncbi:DUF1289 domain-containing protein [Azotobacter chroococcum]|uniref:DUF1289 domain-containing protein n=2 Tax=Azotobacter chroococcum TaxID=353 RepID=A0A4U1KES9_9GAMM|nr:DUF1289 domain-containing protein [Azotobacter chroococcum]QQE90953.1 DUF1289 domain-containing protein [Azotobacter chroococcum]TBW01533.1 DUF1289 domain-containing protein [Azotobacter chroococcum]TBW33119.1 DUF1289 domain-containing protein [Azotobacter chroococcum]TKD31210.1 DUF1289 domain-containing protein [Azotobacter chroococcum]
MMNDERPVPSPCVQLCALDEHDVCLACQRTVDEIRRWRRLDNFERRQILALCAERARAKGLIA